MWYNRITLWFQVIPCEDFSLYDFILLSTFNKIKSYLPVHTWNSATASFFLSIIISFQLTLTFVNLKYKQCCRPIDPNFPRMLLLSICSHCKCLFHSIAHTSFHSRIVFQQTSCIIFPFPLNNVTEQSNKSKI